MEARIPLSNGAVSICQVLMSGRSSSHFVILCIHEDVFLSTDTHILLVMTHQPECIDIQSPSKPMTCQCPDIDNVGTGSSKRCTQHIQSQRTQQPTPRPPL